MVDDQAHYAEKVGDANTICNSDDTTQSYTKSLHRELQLY